MHALYYRRLVQSTLDNSNPRKLKPCANSNQNLQLNVIKMFSVQ